MCGFGRVTMVYAEGGDIFARALDAAMRVFRIDSEMVQNFIELCVRDSADGDVMLQIVQSAGRASDEIVRQLVKEIKLEYQLYLSRMGMSKGRDGQHGLSSLNIESTQSPRRGYNSHGNGFFGLDEPFFVTAPHFSQEDFRPCRHRVFV